MNKNVDRGNSITKTKEPVWKIKVGFYSQILVEKNTINTEIKLSEIKVILN
jgi:hypothetical protein